MSEAAEEYLALQRAKRAGEDHSSTVDADNNVLRMFMRISGDRVMSNITPEHVESFFYGPGGLRDTHVILSKRAGKKQTHPPVSAATHNHYRSRLKTFFAWATSRGYMKRDVMVFTQPLKVERQKRQRPNAITLLALLDQAANARDRAYLAVAVNTALRSSEIRSLKVRDVDLDAGFLAVTILKTKDADEQPITSELDAELRKWLTTYAEDLGRPLRDEDYLFPRRRGGLISHYETAENGEVVMVRHPYVWVPDTPIRETHLIVKHALKQLGLPTYKEGTHTIRRAVAMAYFQNVAKDQGDVAALRETAAFLHHSSVATTEIYLGMTPEKNRRDNRLKGKPFLSAMVEPADNVVPLRSASAGE